MKTFKDLQFGPCNGGTQAKLDFPNGYSISVIDGPGTYSTRGLTYEIAVLDAKGICYDTPITGDVLGHQTSGQVTEIMKQIQELPKVN